MTPRLVSGHFPYLPLRLDVHGRTFTVEALIDTGFDGDVAVPPDLLAGDEPDDYQRWTLADGAVVYTPMYFGTVQVGDVGSLDVLVTALGDEPIVGRGVTDRFRLTLDHGTQVAVEP
jgi:predicted aspartyl protease